MSSEQQQELLKQVRELMQQDLVDNYQGWRAKQEWVGREWPFRDGTLRVVAVDPFGEVTVIYHPKPAVVHLKMIIGGTE